MTTTTHTSAGAAFDPTEHLVKLSDGADYLEVKWRLVWFRSEHPDGQILTDVQEHDRDDGYARVKARVQYDCIAEDGSVRTAVAEGVGTEMVSDFPDYLEKAETKAIGRALAALGYGTQFAADFDMRNPDGSQHIVDSPVSSDRRREAYMDEPGPTFEEQDDIDAPAETETEPARLSRVECEECGQPLTATPPKGRRKGMSAREKAEFSVRRTGRVLCYDCYQDSSVARSVS
jgi:hypothetical protein